jgi:hypothetical protein
MAFNNTPPSPPNVIDDDIQRTINNILKPAAANSDSDSDSEVNIFTLGHPHQQHLATELHSRLFESLCVTLQVERNAWKNKLHSTLQVS